MTSYPKAELLIQRASNDLDFFDGLSSAHKLTANSVDDSGGLFSANVESTYTIGEDPEFLATATVTVNNPPSELIREVQRGSFIQLNAGWTDSEVLPIQPIFHGVVVEASTSIRGGTRSLNLKAISFINLLARSAVRVSVTSDDTYEQALQKIVGGFGGTVRAPPLLRTVKPGPITFNGKVRDAVAQLLSMLQLEHNVKCVAFTSPANPFTVRVSGLDHLGFHLDPEVKFIPVDVTSELVNSASMVYEEVEDPQPVVPLTGRFQENVASILDQFLFEAADRLSTGFSIEKTLDPRVDLGRVVKYQGDEIFGNGFFLVSSVKHSVGQGWVTSMSGPFMEALNGD